MKLSLSPIIYLRKEITLTPSFLVILPYKKILKGLYVDLKKEHAPPIHSLPRIARLAGLSLDEGQLDVLILISSFNIEARYPDIKRSFRKKCTKEYTLEQMQIIKETFRWLKEMIT